MSPTQDRARPSHAKAIFRLNNSARPRATVTPFIKVTRGRWGPPAGRGEERVLLLPAGYEAGRLTRGGLSGPFGGRSSI
jgi:hypothetical protein